MVRGFSKRAVVVRSPDLKGFEQAIFILSGEGDAPQMRTPTELLELAERLADRHRLLQGPPRRRSLWPCIASFLLGSLTTAAALWAITMFIV